MCFLLLDSCVLIDYLKADKSIFRRISRHLGPVSVIPSVAKEVACMKSLPELEALGLAIVASEDAEVELAAQMTGSTSRTDRLCLLAAKRLGSLCVTNDMALRRLCEQEKVSVLWGLEMLLALHRAGGISARTALELAGKISLCNPRHISNDILERFAVKLNEQERLG